MIKPAIDDFLAGLIAALEEDVLPQLTSSYVRGQAEGAISLLRRLSSLWDRIGPYLFEDNRDIEATLHELLPKLTDLLVSGPGDPALAVVCQRLRHDLERPPYQAGNYPSPKLLAERNLVLKDGLVALVKSLDASPALTYEAQSPIRWQLRALFRRMLEREVALMPPLLGARRA